MMMTMSMSAAKKIMLVVVFLAGKAESFVHVASCSSRAEAATTVMAAASSPVGGAGEGAGLTRAEAIRRAVAGSQALVAAGVLIGGSARALAEEEMKDEVQQFAELRGEVEKKGREEATKENLALLSEATAGLKTLNVFIGEKDYKGLRLAMRNPPIANLRSSARKVIIGIDNKDAEEKATSAYKALITSVDKLDGMANRGMKEKEGLKDDKEILEVYRTCVERGSDLITLLPKVL
ncbi:unnamed protein product [Ectocarpus sp. 8 AP-2014]